MSRTSRSEEVSVTGRIVKWLRGEIARGTYRHSEALPSQGTLAELYEKSSRESVSRIPIREALRQLEIEGLVRVEPNSSAYVMTLTRDDVQEIYELRALLEPAVFRHAFEELTPSVLRRAHTILDRLKDEQDSEVWRELDEEFHTLLYEPANRPRYVETINTLRRQVTHLFFKDVDPQRDERGALAEFKREHEAILKACVEEDLEGALAALRKHIRTSARAISEAHRNVFGSPPITLPEEA